MARNGSGLYVRIMNWVADAGAGIPITASRVDAEAVDIGQALTASIANDGQTPIVANLPMSTFRHTNVGNGVAATDYAALGQVQAQNFAWGGTSAGTANAQTITPLPAIAAYAAGQNWRFTAGAGLTNTGPLTLAISGLAARAVQLGGAALRGMEIVGGLTYELSDNGTTLQIIGGVIPFTPNSLINGGFEIWQRGAGGSASIAQAASVNAYTVDRWYLLTQANQASVVSQQTGLTNGSRSCARVQRNSGQTGTSIMVFGSPYATDMLVPLRGSRVTISGWLSSGANWSPTNGNLSITLYVGTGTEGKRGGGFTSETTVVTVIPALTAGSGATFFSATSAAVLPTSATQGEIQVAWNPIGTASTNDWFQIDDVKVEPNVGPSPFDRPLFGDEFARCLRFYEKCWPYATAPAQNLGVNSGEVRAPAITAGATGIRSTWVPWAAEKRVTPTIVYFNPAAANTQARDTTAAADCSATGSGVLNAHGMSWVATGAAGTAAGNAIHVGWTADADI